MNDLRTLLLLPVASIVLASSARPDDTKPTVRVGSPVEVKTVKDMAFVDGAEADPKKHQLDLYLPKDQNSGLKLSAKDAAPVTKP
jgi:hypothetical protein